MKCRCGKEATGRYTVDLDISGIHFCDEHKEDVMHAMICLLGGDDKLAETILDGMIRRL
jgi:hypothetical protein